MNIKKWMGIGFKIVFGLMLIFSGINNLFGFIPIEHSNELASEVMLSLVNAVYLMPLVGILLIGIGIMFVLNKLLPIAALLLAPLSVNFIGFHLALDIEGIVPAIVVFVVNLYFIFQYRNIYRLLLKNNSVK